MSERNDLAANLFNEYLHNNNNIAVSGNSSNDNSKGRDSDRQTSEEAIHSCVKPYTSVHSCDQNSGNDHASYNKEVVDMNGENSIAVDGSRPVQSELFDDDPSVHDRELAEELPTKGPFPEDTNNYSYESIDVVALDGIPSNAHEVNEETRQHDRNTSSVTNQEQETLESVVTAEATVMASSIAEEGEVRDLARDPVGVATIAEEASVQEGSDSNGFVEQRNRLGNEDGINADLSGEVVVDGGNVLDVKSKYYHKDTIEDSVSLGGSVLDTHEASRKPLESYNRSDASEPVLGDRNWTDDDVASTGLRRGAELEDSITLANSALDGGISVEYFHLHESEKEPHLASHTLEITTSDLSIPKKGKKKNGLTRRKDRQQAKCSVSPNRRTIAPLSPDESKSQIPPLLDDTRRLNSRNGSPKRARTKTPSRKEDLNEPHPLYSELVDNLYSRPVVVSILIDKQKLFVLRDSLSPIKPVKGHLDGIVDGKSATSRAKRLKSFTINVYDVVSTKNASYYVYIRDFNLLLQELVEQYSSSVNDYFKPNSMSWWVKNIKKFLLVFDRPTEELATVISKKKIRQMVQNKMKHHQWMQSTTSSKLLSNNNSIVDTPNGSISNVRKEEPSVSEATSTVASGAIKSEQSLYEEMDCNDSTLDNGTNTESFVYEDNEPSITGTIDNFDTASTTYLNGKGDADSMEDFKHYYQEDEQQSVSTNEETSFGKPVELESSQFLPKYQEKDHQPSGHSSDRSEKEIEQGEYFSHKNFESINKRQSPLSSGELENPFAVESISYNPLDDIYASGESGGSSVSNSCGVVDGEGVFEDAGVHATIPEGFPVDSEIEGAAATAKKGKKKRKKAKKNSRKSQESSRATLPNICATPKELSSNRHPSSAISRPSTMPLNLKRAQTSSGNRNKIGSSGSNKISTKSIVSRSFDVNLMEGSLSHLDDDQRSLDLNSLDSGNGNAELGVESLIDVDYDKISSRRRKVLPPVHSGNNQTKRLERFSGDPHTDKTGSTTSNLDHSLFKMLIEEQAKEKEENEREKRKQERIKRAKLSTPQKRAVEIIKAARAAVGGGKKFIDRDITQVELKLLKSPFARKLFVPPPNPDVFLTDISVTDSNIAAGGDPYSTISTGDLHHPKRVFDLGNGGPQAKPKPKTSKAKTR